MPAITDVPRDLYGTRCAVCGTTYGQHTGSRCPRETGALNTRFVPSVFEDEIAANGTSRALRDPAAMAHLMRVFADAEMTDAPMTDPDLDPEPLVSRRPIMRPYIIGYTADAGAWCTHCAERRYGSPPRTSPDEPMQDCFGIADGTLDSEGNDVHPVFSTDEPGDSAMVCGGCSAVIMYARECALCGESGHDEDECTAEFCACGDGCTAGDCGACEESDDLDSDESDEYRDESEPERDPWDDRCSCPNCIAAAAYVGPVE